MVHGLAPSFYVLRYGLCAAFFLLLGARYVAARSARPELDHADFTVARRQQRAVALLRDCGARLCFRDCRAQRSVLGDDAGQLACAHPSIVAGAEGREGLLVAGSVHVGVQSLDAVERLLAWHAAWDGPT